jgi:hypothetical protein
LGRGTRDRLKVMDDAALDPILEADALRRRLATKAQERAAWLGTDVLCHPALILRVLRFCCVNPSCPRATFAAQAEGLTTWYAARGTTPT